MKCLEQDRWRRYNTAHGRQESQSRYVAEKLQEAKSAANKPAKP